MGTVAHPHDTPTDNGTSPLRELQRIRVAVEAQHQELAALRELLDSFARTYLRSRFPYGQPVDAFSDRSDRRRYG